MANWSLKDRDEILLNLNVVPANGLSSASARSRLKRYGHNRTVPLKPWSAIKNMPAGRLWRFAVVTLLISATALLIFSNFPVTRHLPESQKLAYYSAKLLPGCGNEPVTIETPNETTVDVYAVAEAGYQLCNTQTISSYTLTRLPSDVQELLPAEEPILALVLLAMLITLSCAYALQTDHAHHGFLRDFANTSKVRREGKVITLPTAEVVPGDIVILQAGQHVPADIRLITVNSLVISESLVSGAVMPVTKKVFTITKDVALQEQKNMAFGGSFITAGFGEGVVVATGRRTEAAKLMSQYRSGSNHMRMQQKLAQKARRLRWPLILTCIFVFALAFHRQTSDILLYRLLSAAMLDAALVTAVLFPYSLLLVGLIAAAKRSYASGVPVRNVSGFESLAGVDVICVKDLSTADIPFVHRFQSESGIRIIVFSDSVESLTQLAAFNSGIDGTVLTDKDLRRMSQKQYEDKVRGVSLYATDDSAIRSRIITALKRCGHRVVMVGGDNDIPVIKTADIAVIAGKSVASEVLAQADLLLPNGSLASLYESVLHSRRIFVGLREAIKFMHVFGAALTTLVVGSLIFSDVSLLDAVQILLSGVSFGLLIYAFLSFVVVPEDVSREKPASFRHK